MQDLAQLTPLAQVTVPACIAVIACAFFYMLAKINS